MNSSSSGSIYQVVQNKFKIYNITAWSCYKRYIVTAHTMKACKAEQRYSFSHSSPQHWTEVVNFTSQPLYLWERQLLPIKYEAGWLPETLCISWRKEKSLVPIRIQTLGYPTHSQLASCYTDCTILDPCVLALTYSICTNQTYLIVYILATPIDHQICILISLLVLNKSC